MSAYRYGYVHMYLWSQGATEPQKQELLVAVSRCWVLGTEYRSFWGGASALSYSAISPVLEQTFFNIHNYLPFEWIKISNQKVEKALCWQIVIQNKAYAGLQTSLNTSRKTGAVFSFCP